MTENICTTCPHCYQGVEFGSDYYGIALSCPSCSNQFVVESPNQKKVAPTPPPLPPPKLMFMGEPVLFQEGRITITTSRLCFDANWMMLKSITSVSRKTEMKGQIGNTIMIIIGVLLLLMFSSTILAWLGLIPLGVGIVQAYNNRSKVVLCVNNSGGDPMIITGQNGKYIDRVAFEIRKATGA